MSYCVVGAGVIGLLSALRLAVSGAQVTVFDSSNVGSEASWAGGGIVSPLYPWRYSPAVTALAHWSQDFYPQLGDRLLAETGWTRRCTSPVSTGWICTTRRRR